MASALDDQRRTPSWLFMGTNDGLRKRRSGSTDSMLNVSDDESPPGTSTPSKGPFLKSWLPNPVISPKKQQINDSLCDSGFQDASMSSDCNEACDEARNEALEALNEARDEARNEAPENGVPKQSSVLSCVRPLAAILVIFAALSFGLMMMMNKETVEVDHHLLNGKYKSMQFARERIQTSVNKEGGGALDSNKVDPDDPKFRSNSQVFVDEENYFDNSNADEIQDGEMDYPDDPQFRTSFV